MHYADAGTIKFHTLNGYSPRILRCMWTTNSAGEAGRQIPETVDAGTLLRYATFRPTGDGVTGSYAVYLYDQWGVDILDGLCDSLSPNS